MAVEIKCDRKSRDKGNVEMINWIIIGNVLGFSVF